MFRTARPAVASAGAVVFAGTIILFFYDVDYHSQHMALHIVSMNVLAPLLAALITVRWQVTGTRSSLLWTVTFVQLVLLWTWHAPTVYDVVIKSDALQFAMHGLLFLAALLFWFFLLTMSGAARWQTIPALLLTGKLACLLAALLIFAPRTLYDAAGHLSHAAERHGLDDQHLAGLLMITTCPLSYLVAAVAIAAQLISTGAPDTTSSPHRSLTIAR